MVEIIQRVAEIRIPAAVWSYSRLVAKKHCDRLTRKRNFETVSFAELPDGSRHDPLSEFLELEERRRVVDTLWTLSPRLREVLVLYYLDDYRTGEIAAFLEISVEAVKKRLADGRWKLRGMMAMVEGVMRDFRDLIKLGDRAIQRLLREVAEEDLGRVLHVVIPELRAKLEQNLSPRRLEGLRRIPRRDDKAKESVKQFWVILDKLLDTGEIELARREIPQGAEVAVPAIMSGPGQKDRAMWLRQALHELSIKARKHGLFALEQDAECSTDALLTEGLRALVDGTPPETIRARLKSFGNGDIERIVEEGILALQEGMLI
jgi:RNA polymerase sigma factor (sigma-70 family)